jgi:hypothetical protein
MRSALLYYLAQTWTADRQAQRDAPARAARHARHPRPSRRAHHVRGLPAVVARVRTVSGGGSAR